jgi:[protein-PII] uridylyltransferase
MLDDDYFLRHDAENIAWHTTEILDCKAVDLPLVASRFQPEYGGIVFLVFAPARADLFPRITHAFEKLNLNIVDARLHHTRSGFALNTFTVLTPSELKHTDNAIEHYRQSLKEILLAPFTPRKLAGRQLDRTLKSFPIKARVSFSADTREQHTIMEVSAQDRPGLLYHIAMALYHCKIRLVTAKIATYGERAEDMFFITDNQSRPITDPEHTACLEREILSRLNDETDSAGNRATAVINL